MEMALCLLAGALTWLMYRPLHWRLRVILGLLLAVSAGYQIARYRSHADLDIQPVDLAARSEHASALWADTHLAGERVYVTGSDSFWWNTFTDVPQVLGLLRSRTVTEGAQRRAFPDRASRPARITKS